LLWNGARAVPELHLARDDDCAFTMGFLIVGLVLLTLKLMGIAPVADWGWLWVLLPFGLAAAWWTFADASGMTRRRAMQQMEDRKQARRQKAIDALRMPSPRERAEAARHSRHDPVSGVQPSGGDSEPADNSRSGLDDRQRRDREPRR
jgi:small Trp-rich protein